MRIRRCRRRSTRRRRPFTATTSTGKTLARVALALLGVGAATAAGRALGANATTAGFVYLVVVLFAAARLGFAAAVAASLAAAACLNLFFLPPVGAWTISDPANLVALAVFLLTSVLVSFLVERSRHEALKASDAFKTSLLRAVSHDLRTPITAIRLGLEKLRRSAADTADVDAVSSETERLSRRIDNLLAMARLEAGACVPRPEPSPPADLFRATLEALPLVLAGRSVGITVSADAPDALVDPTLTVEILANLLENAARAAPAPTRLDLVASAHPTDSRRVVLDVCDRGAGVTADARHTVASGGLAADAGRAGLGLVICSSLARAMGGSVALLDRAGGGTIARLDLPAAVEASA